MKGIRLILATSLMMLAISQAYADGPVVINNNNNNNPPPDNNSNSNCNNNQSSSNNDTRPGTYYQNNPQGGTDTVYTTGDKKPYIVDNNCNQTPIQPYVYGVVPPGPPGPPGPRGR